MALVAATYLRPGDRVVMDSPTYPNTMATLRRAGARIIGSGVEPAGWGIDALESTARRARPAVSVLIPDFHIPVGYLMPDDERARVSRSWSGSGTIVIVDETLIDFRSDPDGPVPLPMAAHGTRTVTVGSASKSFCGGLRIAQDPAAPPPTR